MDERLQFVVMMSAEEKRMNMSLMRDFCTGRNSALNFIDH